MTNKLYVVSANKKGKETFKSKTYKTQYGAWKKMVDVFMDSRDNHYWAGNIILKEIDLNTNTIKEIAWREA